ncbi:MAG: sigma-70 family RNA polymerase sigma factor [Zoogloea oleivorans]|jgi:RNA polymerase sigma-70 factor (ECF subfamily)|nr:sigma-70 family RNA polymerase sigma factor [Zoogloea oleivorans]MDY0038601.1 sigma-70 family RNA polymerase sigma factor [Zoogloea oleivorans]
MRFTAIIMLGCLAGLERSWAVLITQLMLPRTPFCALWLSWDSLLGIREPRAYLTTTAKRLIVDRIRRQALEEVHLTELAIFAEAGEGYPSPEQIVATLQALEQIAVALEGVSVKAREAFLLHFLEGQSHAEIATHLGVSTRMVGKYLVQSLSCCLQGVTP